MPGVFERLYSEQQNNGNSQGGGGGVFARLRHEEEIRRNPPPSVVRKSQPTPNLTEMLNQRPAAQVLNRPVQTKPYSPVGFTENIKSELRERAANLPQQTPAQGKRLIDIPANVAEGAGDSIGFGIPQQAMRMINNLLVRSGHMSPEEAEQYEQSRQAREQTTSYKVGQFAGYIPPGAAVERGVSAAARPLIQNLPRAGRLATTGAAAGAIEAAAQEGGDVAFRQGEFDPENVALGAGLGGAIGAVTPAVGRGLQAVRNRLRRAPEAQPTPTQPGTDFQPTSTTPTTTPRPNRAVVSLRGLERQISPITRQAIEQADDVPKGVFPEPTPAEPVQQGWFERLFGRPGVGITPRLSRQNRNALTTEGQIVDRPIRKTVQGSVESLKALGHNLWQNYVDMNRPIRKFGEEAYNTAMDASRATQLANVIINDKFVTPEGRVLGEGLRNIIRKVGRGNYNQFTDYLILRHALTRMGRDERVYDESLKMTPEKVQERIAFLESRFPAFRSIGQEWDQYFKNIRQSYGVDGDLITPELAQYLETQNPHYAPMRRQFTDAEKLGLGGARAGGLFSGQKAPIKEVSPTGSTRKIVDPVRSAIEQTEAWVQSVMRNRVMKEVVNKIIAEPDVMKPIAEIVQPKKGQPDLINILREEGPEDFLEELQKDFNKLFRKERLDKDNIVRAMVGGRPVYVKVKDPESLRALIGMGPENANIALSFMSDLVKQGATGVLAPLFAVRAATMDVAQALMQAERPVQHLGYLVGSFFSSLADTFRIPVLRQMAQDFYRAGGGYNAALKSENRLRKNLGSMRQDPLLSARSIGRGVLNTVAFPFRASQSIANIAENMNRIAAYHYKLRQLGGQPTPENIREAMNYAREITVNYSRRGAKSQGWEAIFPYQNAAIQGLYRFGKNFKEHPGRAAGMLAIGVLLPKLGEYMAFHDDPDYQKIPARERYRNLFIRKNEDGTFTKIPLSPEYTAIGAFMVDMLERYRDGDPDAFKGVSDALVNAYTPPVISGVLQGATQGGGIEQSLSGLANATSLGPILGAMANQTFYGAPIESMRLTDRSPSQRYDERTSAVAKWLGEKMNWSPMKIDYVLRSYGGDPARLLLPLTSEVGSGRTRETLLRNFITDPVFTNTISDDYYRGKELLTQAYRDYQETGKPLPEWYNDNLRKYVTSTAKGSLSKQLSALNERKRAIQTNKSLSNEQKSEQLRETQEQINDLLIDINAMMREAGVPLLNR